MALSRASIFICVSSEETFLSAPSPVCTTLTAALVFFSARLSPATCALCCSEITSPAGPSAPVLIFRPVDNRLRAALSEYDGGFRLDCAEDNGTLLRIASAKGVSAYQR